SPRFHDLSGEDALTPTSLNRVLVDGGPLGVAALGGDQDVLVPVLHDRHVEDLVVLVEAHADDTGRGATHRPQRLVVGVEPDRLRAGGHHQQVVVGRLVPGTDYLVVASLVDRDYAHGPGPD